MGTGHTPSRRKEEYWENCTIPWVTVADIHKLPGTGLRWLTDTEQHISELGLQNSAAVLHPPGTVMLSRTASIGHACVIGRPMATTQAFVTWTPTPGLDSRYLLLALKALSPELDARSYGSTHKTIYFPDVEDLKIPLPPLKTQRAIADFLEHEIGRIDSLVTKKQELQSKLVERFDALIMVLIFASSHEAWIPLRRLVDLLPGFSFSSSDMTSVSEGNVRILRGINVAPGSVRWNETVYVPQETANAARRFELRAGDIVIGMDRPVIAGGMRVAMLTFEDCPSLLVQRVARIRPRPDVDPHFIRHALQSQAFVEYFSPITTGVSVPHISPDQILSFRLPPHRGAEQIAIAERLNAEARRIRTLQERLGQQTSLLETHRRALITAAVTGQLDTSGAV